jgi:hypothetical protein
MFTIDGKPSRARVSRETSGGRTSHARVSRETSGGRASSTATSLSIQPPASSSPGATTDQPSAASSGTGLPSSYSGSRPAPRNPTDAPCAASRTALATKPQARSPTSALIGRGCRQLNIQRPPSPHERSEGSWGPPESAAGAARDRPNSSRTGVAASRAQFVKAVEQTVTAPPGPPMPYRPVWASAAPPVAASCSNHSTGHVDQSPRCRPTIAMRRPRTSPSCANSGGGRVVLQGVVRARATQPSPARTGRTARHHPEVLFAPADRRCTARRVGLPVRSRCRPLRQLRCRQERFT